MGFREAYRANEFVVEIDGIESPGITKISGLSEGDSGMIEQKEGGSNIIHKISSGVIKFESLTLERNMDGSKADEDFLKWFQEMFKLDRTGQGSSKSRRNGAVIKRHFGQEVLRFAFYNAWVKSSKFSDLEAASENLMKQTIVLEHEGLERVK